MPHARTEGAAREEEDRHAVRSGAAPLLLAVLALACAGRRGPPPAEPQRFDLAGLGALELPVPGGWRSSLLEAEAPAALTVRLDPEGGAFVVLVTPFPNERAPGLAPGAESAEAGADTAQVLAELARRKALVSSVEREIALEELRGEEGVHGYWFQATDRELEGREPGKDEWRHVLQGAAAVGDLIVAFTLLDNAPGPQREAVLELVRRSRHLARAAPAPEGGTKLRFEPDPDAETVPLSVAYPGRRWSVLVDLPGFRMFAPRPAEDGAGVLVLGESPESGFVASVTLRDAAGAADAGACRDRALERIRASAPELRDLRTADEEGAARATFVLDELRGRAIRQEHAHLFLLREGVCADVHVSKADPGPGDLARMEGILGSVRFGETL